VFAGFATAATAGAIAPRLSFWLGADDAAPRTLHATTVDAGVGSAPAGPEDADASVADTSIADTSVAGTSVAGTSVAGTSVSDTSVADTSVADTSVADTSVAEEAPAAVLPRLAARERIRGLVAGGRTRDRSPGRLRDAEPDPDRTRARARARALALELALRHQLVTDGTNLFLVHRRVGDDKATDLPALQKITSMLAAGWGGTGSVHDVLPALPAQSVASISAASSGVAPRMAYRSPREYGPFTKRGQSFARLLDDLAGTGPDATPDPSAAFAPTVRRWLDRLRDRLHADADLDVLVAELEREKRPAAIDAALASLADAGIPPRSAWVLLLAWIAACRGTGTTPGPRAMAVLDAVIGALPPSTVGPGMARVAACLADEEVAAD
jgi:hypothetical protein